MWRSRLRVSLVGVMSRGATFSEVYPCVNHTSLAFSTRGPWLAGAVRVLLSPSRVALYYRRGQLDSVPSFAESRPSLEVAGSPGASTFFLGSATSFSSAWPGLFLSVLLCRSAVSQSHQAPQRHPGSEAAVPAWGRPPPPLVLAVPTRPYCSQA